MAASKVRAGGLYVGLECPVPGGMEVPRGGAGEKDPGPVRALTGPIWINQSMGRRETFA